MRDRGYARAGMRLPAILAWVAFVAAGQALSLGFGTSSLWPFNPVSVFRQVSTGPRATAAVTRVTTPEGERNIVSEGLCNHRVVRRFDRAVARSGSTEERQRIVKVFFGLAAAKPGGAAISGLRMYSVEMDLASGEVVRERLRAEYVRR